MSAPGNAGQGGNIRGLVDSPGCLRSGTASCMAKIGLASKSLSAEEEEVMELLDVVIELLFKEKEDEFKDKT
jgi:hypothetical protein